MALDLRKIKEELKRIRLVEEVVLRNCGFKAASEKFEPQAELLTKLMISHRLRPIEIAEQLLKELEETLDNPKAGG